MDIANTFLNYFGQRDHAIIPSSPLVPQNDNSLMFTNSGMVQFKNVFIGSEYKPYTRATTCQKCVRAGGKHNDLENVGYTNRHHTFFEMLGNFSFGDYFKEEAIKYAWDFVSNVLTLDKDRLHVTVYHDDWEAFDFWKRISGLHDSRIVRISTSDNFWSMGETGPCGPCSEIFYDLGEDAVIKGGKMTGTVGENDRYMEIWNLVFMQYQKFADGGDMLKLPKPSIDTGAGLERLNAVMEGVSDTYKTSSYKRIITEIKSIYGDDVKNDTAYRVIADHIKSICFLISDNVLPERDGRGYVLRRIMRRAIRYANQLAPDKQLLHNIVPFIANHVYNMYPVILEKELIITRLIQMEESLFSKTLKTGLDVLSNELQKPENIKNNVFDGDVIFKLYDTYGFPLDASEEILREHNLTIDMNRFNEAMKMQRIKGTPVIKQSLEISKDIQMIKDSGLITDKLYYKYITHMKQQVLLMFDNNYKEIQKLPKGETGFVIFDKTIFYPQGGGQVSDTGLMGVSNVLESSKINDNIIIHKILANEDINVGVAFECITFRENAPRNHTATHLLQAALRKVLGDNIQQRGSNVDENGLRFDFSTNQVPTKDQLIEIEDIVNKWINNNEVVHVSNMKKKDAEALGALCFFEDKYGDIVRVIRIGENVSIELCGGTHVENTKEIKSFKIISESSIGSGIRRIAALTGTAANSFTENIEPLQQEVSKIKQKLIDQEKSNKETLNAVIQAMSNVTREMHSNYTIKIYKGPSISNDAIQTLLHKSAYDIDQKAIWIYISENAIFVSKSAAFNENFACGTIIKQMISKFGGKGGGTNTYAAWNLPDSIKISEFNIKQLFNE